MSIWSWVNQHRGWSIGVSLLIMVLIGAVAAYLLVFRASSTPLNLRQALRLYRARQETTGSAKSSDLPATGVYNYATSGHESLSILGMSRSFPSVTPMIVSGGGCLDVRWEPLTQHVEETTECPAKGRGVAVSSTTSIERIAGTTTRTVVSCPKGTYIRPPDAAAGNTWSTTCHSGSSLTVAARGAVLGRTTVTVDGHRVPAWHTRLTLYFRGSEDGVSPTDYWLSSANNLILRQHETVSIHQSAGPLGSVNYREAMSVTVRSLHPAA